MDRLSVTSAHFRWISNDEPVAHMHATGMSCNNTWTAVSAAVVGLLYTVDCPESTSCE